MPWKLCHVAGRNQNPDVFKILYVLNILIEGIFHLTGRSDSFEVLMRSDREPADTRENGVLQQRPPT